jgi:hypothetical protein
MLGSIPKIIKINVRVITSFRLKNREEFEQKAAVPRQLWELETFLEKSMS